MEKLQFQPRFMGVSKPCLTQCGTHHHHHHHHHHYSAQHQTQATAFRLSSSEPYVWQWPKRTELSDNKIHRAFTLQYICTTNQSTNQHRASQYLHTCMWIQVALLSQRGARCFVSVSSQRQQYKTSSGVFYCQLRRLQIYHCVQLNVLFDITLRLLVINISLSSPGIKTAAYYQ